MNDSQVNGRSKGPHSGPPASLYPEPAPPPPAIAELAQACVGFVERAVGVRLDYTAETLSVLDHYLRSARADLQARPEARQVIAHSAGAYFGEVVRRRVASWWHLESGDPLEWQIRLEPVYLAFSPVAMAADAILVGVADANDPWKSPSGDELGMGHIVMDDEDNDLVVARLAELPPVDDDEFFALTTRIEVIDIAVDASKARMMRDGLAAVVFAPSDYTDD